MWECCSRIAKSEADKGLPLVKSETGLNLLDRMPHSACIKTLSQADPQLGHVRCPVHASLLCATITCPCALPWACLRLCLCSQPVCSQVMMLTVNCLCRVLYSILAFNSSTPNLASLSALDCLWRCCIPSSRCRAQFLALDGMDLLLGLLLDGSKYLRSGRLWRSETTLDRCNITLVGLLWAVPSQRLLQTGDSCFVQLLDTESSSMWTLVVKRQCSHSAT